MYTAQGEFLCQNQNQKDTVEHYTATSSPLCANVVQSVQNVDFAQKNIDTLTTHALHKMCEAKKFRVFDMSQANTAAVGQFKDFKANVMTPCSQAKDENAFDNCILEKSAYITKMCTDNLSCTNILPKQATTRRKAR
jgi:hypothetical protein